MSKIQIPEWATKRLNTRPACVNEPLPEPEPSVNKVASKDRRKPGYMAEYMRKRRAK